MTIDGIYGPFILISIPGSQSRLRPRKYRALLKELAVEPFAKERFLKDLEALEKGTKDLPACDVKAAIARKDMAGGPGMFGKPSALETFIEKRTHSLKAQLDGKSKGFIPNGFGDFPPRAGVGRPVTQAKSVVCDAPTVEASGISRHRDRLS
jgi:hypothetical protein